MKEVVLATRNPHKGAEMAALLNEAGIQVRTLDQFHNAPDVVEDGETCEANAIKKATTIATWTGRIAVADDTGLAVDALEGRPGVYAARYAGEHATYEDNCNKLLGELAGVPSERRTARFMTVVALAMPGTASVQPGTARVQVVHGVLEGRIADRPSGHGGFGYDPVFFVPRLGKTLAELTPEEKNAISHRAQAFARAKTILRQWLNESLQGNPG